MADLLTRLGLRPQEVRASAVALDPAQQPERPLEKTWDDSTILTVYQDDPWPYVCANIIAGMGSTPPLKVGKVNSKNEFKPVPSSHPVQQLFDSPNPEMTGEDFRLLLLLYLELVGHAPIELVKPKVGRTIGSLGRQGFELYPVNPSRWKITLRSNGTISGYVLERDSRIVNRWDTAEMTYLRWLNPNDRYYGLGFVASVRQPVMAEEYAAIRDKEFERRYGVPPGILTSKQPIGSPVAQEIQRRWEQMTGGYKNAGRIAVLGNDTTYQAISLTARDAMELDQRKWRVQQMAAASGVPMVILVGMKDATFANAGEAVDFLWEFTLQPKLTRIANMVTHRLLPLITPEPLVARFDYSEVDALNDNELEVAQRALAQVNAGALPTVNEVREQLGLTPHVNAEVGAMIVLPQTITVEKPENVLALADLGMQGAEAALDAQMNPPEDVPPAPAKVAKSQRSDRERALSPAREGFARDLRSYFASIRRALQTRRLAEPSVDDLLDEMLDIINADRFRKRLPRITRPYLEMALQLGAEEATRLLGTDFSIAASQDALQQITRHLDTLEVQIRNTTNAEVRQAITEGLSKGEGVDDLRARIDALFEGYEQWRVDRIVRTEVSAAYEMGALKQFEGAGVSQVDVEDGDEDEECAAANGSVWSVDEALSNPLSHPNCTRVFYPHTEANDV